MIPSVEVWLDDLNGCKQVGMAYFNLRNGHISTRFEYTRKYLSSPHPISISPDLPLSATGGYTQNIPASFRDCTPDRWGRRLIERNLRTKSGNIPRQPDEVDYLLGVSDEAREGALRFKLPLGEWLDSNSNIPPVVMLPELLDASRNILTSEESHEELKLLLDAGSSSLGGARPKASVLNDDKLLLAKFSRDIDSYDVIGVEKSVLDIMPACGIGAPASSLVRFGSQAVLLIERFDRLESKLHGTRIPYVSAMSVLGLKDGDQATYLDLCEHIFEFGGLNAIEQMLRRVMLSIAINNTDDHLRNHGFLYKNGNWQLSPCFDVNPNTQTRFRQTPIIGNSDNELEEFIELARIFEVPDKEFKEIGKDVAGSLQSFENVMRKNSVPEKTVGLILNVVNRGRDAVLNMI